jgi:iron complex outermembrane receptor protein
MASAIPAHHAPGNAIMVISVRSALLSATILAMPVTAHAQAADAVQLASADTAAVTDIVVLGFGQSRQVQTIDASDIAVLTPGTSPLKAIEKLPGVNFQSADPFGAYEWSTRISLRGFNQNQLGFTLDGIPLGDMSYGNYNGLHISRAIISENIGTTTVAQGAGALGTASTSNLGGTLQFTSRTPSDAFAITASGTYGDSETIRGFIRVDTGDMTGGGLKGYVSYGYLGADKWKGVGEQRQHQVNAKLVQELDRGSITAWFSFSDRRENDYQDLSLDMIDRLGYEWDNISGDFELAKRIARIAANRGDVAGIGDPTLGTTYPAPIATVDDAYFDAAGLRRDYVAALTFDAALTDALSLRATGYYHDNEGQGIWYTPYVGTPGGAPISIRTTEYDIARAGAVVSAALETGANRLEIGGWYESNSFRNARRFYGLADTPTPSRDSLDFQSDPFFTQWDVEFDTDTFQYHVADTLDIGEMVTLNGGWKGYKVTNRANPLVAGGLASGEISASDWFLPQVGAIVRFGGNVEVFANFTQNMRAFVSAATAGPFSTTQEGFDAIRDDIKPEKSDTFEIGGRFRMGGFQASLAGYYVEFRDRLQAFPNGAGIVGNPSTLQNVGDVRNIGVEATLLWQPIREVSLLANYSYNNSEYQDDIRLADGTLFAATAGKTVVDSPKHLLKGEIVYDNERFFARAGANYMSKRFFNLENDRSVDDRVLVDAAIGYRFGGEGLLGGFAIEGSVTNLTDERYVSTIGSNGFGVRGDNQTLLAGAPRQWFVTLRKGF